MPGGTGADLGARAGALRVLATLLGSGLSLRAALCQWSEQVPEPERSALRAVSRRLRLGDTVEGALQAAPAALGPDGDALAAALGLHARLGGDPGRSVESLASAVERKAELEQAARAAVAGAKLSGRVVAGLALLAVLAVPLRGAALLDATGILITVTGAALALAGLACMERLVPPSPGDDPVALMAALVAGLLRSGLPLRAALTACLQRPPAELSAPARRAGRLVNLGASWSQALAACGDEALAELGVVGRRAQVSGMPIADALERWAERRRREALAAFEAELSRAPVLMVIPLTLLVLPSFVLLGVAPFLRSL